MAIHMRNGRHFMLHMHTHAELHNVHLKQKQKLVQDRTGQHEA